MTTPTAVSTTRKILHDKIKFEDLKLLTGLNLKLNMKAKSYSSVSISCKYGGGSIVTEGVLDILKRIDWDLVNYRRFVLVTLIQLIYIE